LELSAAGLALSDVVLGLSVARLIGELPEELREAVVSGSSVA
jgi:hypothetical protein